MAFDGTGVLESLNYACMLAETPMCSQGVLGNVVGLE